MQASRMFKATCHRSSGSGLAASVRSLQRGFSPCLLSRARSDLTDMMGTLWKFVCALAACSARVERGMAGNMGGCLSQRPIVLGADVSAAIRRRSSGGQIEGLARQLPNIASNLEGEAKGHYTACYLSSCRRRTSTTYQYTQA